MTENQQLAEELTNQIKMLEEYLIFVKKLNNPDIDNLKIINYTEEEIDQLTARRDVFLNAI